MRFVPNKRCLPRNFAQAGRGIVAEADIWPLRHGRLAAKLLVFENEHAMREFWKQYTGFDISRHCTGVVNALAEERFKVASDGTESGRRLCGDRRYFCMIGLCLGNLSGEVICHEAVHAGYCYEKRVRRMMFGKAVGDFDEERIAYPTGSIAGGITDFLHKKKLFSRKPVKRRR